MGNDTKWEILAEGIIEQEISKYRKELKFDKGITKNITEASEEAAICCAKKAYLDVRRNLVGIGSWNKKEDYKSEIYEAIAESIYELFKKECSQVVFEEWHKGVCEKIEKLTTEYETLAGNCLIKHAYGTAQKWLNMTLKDMYAWGLWGAEMEKWERHLHVPVDSYIMEAASLPVSGNSIWLGVKIPYEVAKKNGDTSGVYSELSSKKWSKWSDKNYIPFQQELRQAFKKNLNGESLVKWEFVAWDEIAKKRKE